MSFFFVSFGCTCCRNCFWFLGSVCWDLLQLLEFWACFSVAFVCVCLYRKGFGETGKVNCPCCSDSLRSGIVELSLFGYLFSELPCFICLYQNCFWVFFSVCWNCLSFLLFWLGRSWTNLTAIFSDFFCCLLCLFE